MPGECLEGVPRDALEQIVCGCVFLEVWACSFEVFLFLDACNGKPKGHQAPGVASPLRGTRHPAPHFDDERGHVKTGIPSNQVSLSLLVSLQTNLKRYHFFLFDFMFFVNLKRVPTQNTHTQNKKRKEETRSVSKSAPQHDCPRPARGEILPSMGDDEAGSDLRDSNLGCDHPT